MKKGRCCMMAMLDDAESMMLDTIKKFSLISKSDKVLVAVSGGKDSSVLLHFLSKHYKGQITAATIDPGVPKYSRPNLKNTIGFCKSLGIDLKVISFKDVVGLTLEDMKPLLDEKGVNLNYCTICGILKRHIINSYALHFGATKVATGHNLDDVSESLVMNQIRSQIGMSQKIVPGSRTLKD